MEKKNIPLIFSENECLNNISTKNEEKKEIINVNVNNNSSISSYNSACTDDSTSEIKLCESPFIYHKEKYLIDKEKKEIISLYTTFKYLKEKYCIKNSRKNRMDCIIKKVKTKYMNAIHDSIKYCVKLNINKLPQYFITNIKIEYNKMYLNKTVEQIYTEFHIIPSVNELINKKLIKKGKIGLLINLMNSPLKDIYQYYLQSDLYKYHRKCILKKEGENSAKLYDYIAENICKYFLYNKGNKKLNNNVNNNLYEKENMNKNINYKKDINNFESTYEIKNNYYVPLNNNNDKFKFNVTKID